MPELQDELAARIRSRIGSWPDIVEKRMFGSLAFMLNGHILIAARKDGSALVQVGKSRNDMALARAGASQMIMRGGPMVGFIEVGPDDLDTEEAVAEWIAFAKPYVRSLPGK